MYYEIEVIETGYTTNSYDIIEIWKFIVSNKKLTFHFFIDGVSVTREVFLKAFIFETKNKKNRMIEYLELYKILNKSEFITYKQFLYKQKK